MTEEKALKWARSSASCLAIAADDGDKAAQADLHMMALSYAQGWWAREREVQRAAARRPAPSLMDRLLRPLAADVREC